MHHLPPLTLRPRHLLLPRTTPRWASSTADESVPRRYRRGPRQIHDFRRPSWIDPERWQEVSPSRKHELSHAGRIEETHFGQEAAQPCHRCAQRGTKCMIYTGEGQRMSKSKRCSACRRAGLPCSHSSSNGQSRGGAPWNDGMVQAKEGEIKAEQKAERELGLRKRLEKFMRQSDARAKHLARQLNELQQRVEEREDGEERGDSASGKIATGDELSVLGEESTNREGLEELESSDGGLVKTDEGRSDENGAGMKDSTMDHGNSSGPASPEHTSAPADHESASPEWTSAMWSELSRLLDKTTRLESYISRLRAEFKHLRDNDVKNDANNIDTLYHRINDLESHFEHLQRRTPDIRNQMSMLHEQIVNLRNLQDEARGMKAQAKEVHALRAETQDMRREVNRFKGQNDDVRTLKVQQGDVRARLARLEAENVTLRAALEQSNGSAEKVDEARDAERSAPSSVFDATRY